MAKRTSWHSIMLIAVAVLFAGSAVLPLSYSKGVSEYTLYGYITDGATCMPIQGATVSAPFNSNTSNITNSTGGYVLRLGYGNWTVTVSKPGYTAISFNTPYETTGAYMVNEYLLMPGTTASNCTKSLHSNSSTVPSTITAMTTQTTVPSTTPSGTEAKSGGGRNGLIVDGAIVVLAIIGVLAYLLLGSSRRKGDDRQKKTGHEHVDEHKQAAEKKQ